MAAREVGLAGYDGEEIAVGIQLSAEAMGEANAVGAGARRGEAAYWPKDESLPTILPKERPRAARGVGACDLSG